MDIKLRIYRTWSWKLACSQSEIKIGGLNPMKLKSHDELQYLSGDLWIPVEIVEAEKPLQSNDRCFIEEHQKIINDFNSMHLFNKDNICLRCGHSKGYATHHNIQCFENPYVKFKSTRL